MPLWLGLCSYHYRYYFVFYFASYQEANDESNAETNDYVIIKKALQDCTMKAAQTKPLPQVFSFYISLVVDEGIFIVNSNGCEMASNEECFSGVFNEGSLS